MLDREPHDRALAARRRGERSAAAHLWKLGGLLVLVLLMADLVTRQIGLLAGSTPEPVPARATANFFSLQVGDFHAEIRWSTLGREE